MKDTLLEELAELEHDQWVRIRRATFAKAKEIEPGVFLIEKLQAAVWKDMFKPYAELSEELKEYDRIEARKVLKILSRRPSTDKSAELVKRLRAMVNRANEVEDGKTGYCDKMVYADHLREALDEFEKEAGL